MSPEQIALAATRRITRDLTDDVVPTTHPDYWEALARWAEVGRSLAAGEIEEERARGIAAQLIERFECCEGLPTPA